MVYEVLFRNIPVSNVAIVFHKYESEREPEELFQNYYSTGLTNKTNQSMTYIRRWVKMSPNDDCNPNESTKRLALLTASQCA